MTLFLLALLAQPYYLVAVDYAIEGDGGQSHHVTIHVHNNGSERAGCTFSSGGQNASAALEPFGDATVTIRNVYVNVEPVRYSCSTR